jgi:hypothetical protein
MYGLDLTARVSVSGPPPCAPVGPAALQVGPGPLQGSGAATWRPRPDPSGGPEQSHGKETPARHARTRQPRGLGPPFLQEGVRPATWHPGGPRGPGPPIPSGEGVRPATWCPGGHNQAGPDACPVAARLLRYTSPTTALNATAARAEAAYGLSAVMRAEPADTTVSPPVTEAARHITVRRPAVLRRHAHGKGNQLCCARHEACTGSRTSSPLRLNSGCRLNSASTTNTGWRCWPPLSRNLRSWVHTLLARSVKTMEDAEGYQRILASPGTELRRAHLSGPWPLYALPL